MEKRKSIVDSILNDVDCLAMLLMIVPLAISLLVTYASIDTSQFVQKFLLAIHENAFIIMFLVFVSAQSHRLLLSCEKRDEKNVC